MHISRKSRVLGVFLIALLFGVHSAHSQAAQDQQAPRPQLADGYQIGARDLLEISVFDVEQLNTSVRVSEDGQITLPLLGAIEAAGLTRSALEERIETALARYVTDPQVSVFIREFQSQRISVIGAVHDPGTIEMVGRTTLLEAVSDAGGINFENATGKVTVLRASLSGAPLEVDLNDLLARGDVTLNIALQAGDTVNVVPKDVYFIYVYGQVRNPGSYDLKEPITLLQAVSLSGGLAERAARNKIVILRRNADGTQERLEVNLQKIIDGETTDFPILANDVIIVQETFF